MIVIVGELWWRAGLGEEPSPFELLFVFYGMGLGEVF
jgi:hypothetical protein